MTIERLDYLHPGNELQLITDSQDVEWTLHYLGFGKKIIDRYQGLFLMQKNGEITRCYAFKGTVPYINKEVTHLNLK